MAQRILNLGSGLGWSVSRPNRFIHGQRTPDARRIRCYFGRRFGLGILAWRKISSLCPDWTFAWKCNLVTEVVGFLACGYSGMDLVVYDAL